MTLLRASTLNKLKARQAAIQYKSVEDEGAAEYYAEIESVIMALEQRKSDAEVVEAAAWAGLESDLVYK